VLLVVVLPAVRPRSPARLVTTLMKSEAAFAVGFLLTTMLVPPAGTLLMTVLAGMAPAVSLTASLAAKPALLLTVTVILPFVTEPLTVVMLGGADGGAVPAKPLGFVVVVLAGPEAPGKIPEGAAVG
jgi:hypothetical protein